MISLAQNLLLRGSTQEQRIRLLLIYVYRMEGVTKTHLEKMVSTANLDGLARRRLNQILGLDFQGRTATDQGMVGGGKHISNITGRELKYYAGKAKEFHRQHGIV